MKEQYQEEISQIHVPGELLDRTRRAMVQEEERLKAQQSHDKVIYMMKAVGAAAVVLVSVMAVVLGFGSHNDEQTGIGMQLSGKEDVQLQSIERNQHVGIEEIAENILEKIEDFFKKDEP